MKKLLLIILILLPCEIGAQEGCGGWVKINDLICPPYPTCFAFWIDGKIETFDSVWVPKPYPEIHIEWDTVWDHRIVGDTLIIPPGQMTIEDTLYTDWMYADSIYVFFLGKRFIWIRE